MRRLVAILLALAAAALIPSTAVATEHIMKVNELLGSADGSPGTRFVELLDAFDEPFPGPAYRIASYQPNGDLFDAQSLGNPFAPRDNTKPYLISTAAADTKYGTAGDKAMTVQLPMGSSGQVCFENMSTSTVIHCLSYGTVTNPVATESGNEHGPALVDGKSLQRCSSGIVAAAPTPKRANSCSPGGAGGGGGGGGGGGSDTKSPGVRLRLKKRQDVDKLAVVVKSSEDARVRVQASVSVPTGAARTLRFKTVRKSLRAGVRKKLRLKLKRSRKRAVKRALARGRRLRAKIKITVKDKAGNATVKRVRVRLRN